MLLSLGTRLVHELQSRLSFHMTTEQRVSSDISSQKHMDKILSNILSSHELEASHLERTCDDDLFSVTIDEMKDYEILAPHFGVTDVEVYEIQQNNPHNYKLAKQRFLQLWRHNKGSGATIRALVIAFLKEGNKEAAEAIVTYVKQVVSCQQSNPDSVHPEKAYPNWDKMSQEEKKAKREELILENHKVKKKFATCFRRIVRSFERREASVIDLKTNVRLLKKPSELASAETVAGVFFLVSEHSSFFNYQLLNDILEEMGNEEERELLSEYKNDILKPYLERSIFEVPSDSTATSASKSSTSRLCLKLFEKIDLTAQDVIIIKHDLAKLLKLPSLELAHYDVGSIHLVFAISQFIYNNSPITSPLRQYIVWEKDSESYVITADIALILFTKCCPEVDVINKILKSRQNTIDHMKKQLEIKDEEIARVKSTYYDAVLPHDDLTLKETSWQLEQEKAQDAIESLHIKLKTKDEEIKVMNKKYHEVIVSYQKLSDDMSPSEDERIKVLGNNNNHLMEMLKVRDKEKGSLESALEHLKSEKEELHHKLQTEKKISQRKSQQLEREKKERQDAIESLHTKLKIKDEETKVRDKEKEALEHLKSRNEELHHRLETEKKLSQGKSWQLEKYEREKKERQAANGMKEKPIRIAERKYKLFYQTPSDEQHDLLIQINDDPLARVIGMVPSPLKNNTWLHTISNLKNPYGVAIASDGRIAVSEFYGHRVSVFDSNGIKLNEVGEYGKGEGQFGCPWGIALTNKDEILLVDKNNSRIHKFSLDGKFLKATSGRTGSRLGEFSHKIAGIAAHPDTGMIYVCDCDNNRIQILNPDLTFVDEFGSFGYQKKESGENKETKFYRPYSIDFDDEGFIYVVDKFNSRVQKLTLEGKHKLNFGSEVLSDPVGLVVDRNAKKVFVSNWKDHSVTEFDTDGNFIKKVGIESDMFSLPSGMAVDKQGRLYVTDRDRNCVKIL